MEKAPHKSKTILIIIAVAVVAIAATAAFFLLRTAPTDAGGEGLQMDANVVTDDGSNMQDLLAQMQEKADASAVIAEYSASLGVSATGEGTTYYGNPEGNSYPVVFTLSLEGEEIYRSGLVPVGSHIEKVQLSKTPPAGTHSLVLTYRLMDEQTGEEASRASFGVTLQVEE